MIHLETRYNDDGRSVGQLLSVVVTFLGISGIFHFEDTHVHRTDVEIQLRHVKRREEDELTAWLHRRGPDHHVHAQSSIDEVHKDIELVETTERSLHVVPQRQDEAGRGERSLAARQRTIADVLRVGHFIARYDDHVDLFLLVVDVELATEMTPHQQITGEDHFERQRDRLASAQQPFVAMHQRRVELLDESQQRVGLALDRLVLQLLLQIDPLDLVHVTASSLFDFDLLFNLNDFRFQIVSGAARSDGFIVHLFGLGRHLRNIALHGVSSFDYFRQFFLELFQFLFVMFRFLLDSIDEVVNLGQLVTTRLPFLRRTTHLMFNAL